MWQETVKDAKNEKHTLQDLDYGQKTETLENETETLYDLEYGKKH